MPERHLSGKYKLVKLLSHGPFAKVYQARDTRSGQSVAIKVIEHHQKADNLNLVEIEALRRIRHRHVIKPVEVFAGTADVPVFIVTEFAKCGDLFEKVAEMGRLSEDLSRHFFQQLISAVKHCHSRGVFHRDIKPENLLLDDKWGLKLSDFGLCAVTDGPDRILTDPCGTHEYAAPEILAGRGYDGAKADVWSCGVVLYVINAGFLPFNVAAGGDVAGMWRKMQRGDFVMPKWMSPGLKWLLLRILDPNPETRITIDEILEDGWFRKGYTEEIDDDDSESDDSATFSC